MRNSCKETIVINDDYQQLSQFIHELPDVFATLGTTTYAERNTIKTFEVNNITLNVKAFKVPRLINQIAYALLRDSKAKRSYLYAMRLLEVGINTPAPIAYIEYKRAILFKNSFYVSEHIEVDNEMRVLQKGTLQEHQNLLTAFAKFTAHLHQLKVFHIDYSSGNIMYTLRNGAYTFYLVDLNRMEFDKEIGAEKAAHNFRRLWGSDEMILYFAEIYAKERGFEPKEFQKSVLKYREQFWTKFNQKYPDVSPYIKE